MIDAKRLSSILGAIPLSLLLILYLFKQVIPRDVSFIMDTIAMVMLPIGLFIAPAKRLVVFVRIFPLIFYATFASEITSSALDIPNVLQSQYSYIEGKPENFNISPRYHDQRFTINGIPFNVGNLIKIDSNKAYKITYLPHSKYVLAIREVMNNKLVCLSCNFNYILNG